MIRGRHIGIILMFFALVGLLVSCAARHRSPNVKLIVAANQARMDKLLSALRLGADPNAAEQISDSNVVEDTMFMRAQPVASLMGACYSPISDTRVARIIDILLDHGANPDVQDTRGQTPLMLCGQKGLTESVEMLLQHGADPAIKDADGRTAAIRAAELARWPIVKMIEGTSKTQQLTTATLLGALWEGSVTRTQMAIAERADVNATNFLGWSALSMAAERCDKPELSSLLIRAGANVDNGGVPGASTPLTMATDRGCIQIMRELLEAGADVNIKNGWPYVEDGPTGETPIFAAVRNGNREALALLLAKGADTRVTNPNGQTVLDIATDKKIRAQIKTSQKGKD